MHPIKFEFRERKPGLKLVVVPICDDQYMYRNACIGCQDKHWTGERDLHMCEEQELTSPQLRNAILVRL